MKWNRSLANPRWMRRVRDRIGGWSWILVRRSRGPVTTVTLIRRGWEYTPDNLHLVDPKKLMNQLRTDLLRCAPNSADGWAIFFLHGEYEPETKTYRLHAHGLVGGQMIDAVEKLREKKAYKSSRKNGSKGKKSSKGKKGVQRVRRSQKPLTNLPEPLTYLLKSYWPAMREGEVGTAGKTARNNAHGRPPEPYHSLYLLQLDRWTLADITLLVGVRVTRRGFMPNRKR